MFSIRPECRGPTKRNGKVLALNCLDLGNGGKVETPKVDRALCHACKIRIYIYIYIYLCV